MTKFVLRLFDFFIELLFPSEKYTARIQKLIETNTLASLPRANTLRSNIISLFSYQDPHVKTLIKQIKYKHNHTFTKEITKLLYEEMLGTLSDEISFHLDDKPIVIPVPMSSSRKKERGYNQTENIILEIKLHDKQQVFDYRSDIVFKKENFKPQTQTSTRDQRLQNIKKAFLTKDPKIIKNRTFFIIDDVVTTGATISEIESLLMHYGANQVYAFTIAH